MDSSKNLSFIALAGLTTIIVLNLLKDNFQMIENYQEDDNESYTYGQVRNKAQVGKKETIEPTGPSTTHGYKPFGDGGDFFMQPFIADSASANGYSETPEAYKVYMANISAATPNEQNFRAIGSEFGADKTPIPGPSNYLDNVASVDSQVLTGRAADLSLCAQNMSTMASTGNGAIAETLLPAIPSDKVEGFSDCSATSALSNQTFLSRHAGGQVGNNTTAGSLRNASQDFRSEPPCPMMYVGPWMNSSIYPDLLRRPLEGCGPSFGMYGNGPLGAQVPTKTDSIM